MQSNSTHQNWNLNHTCLLLGELTGNNRSSSPAGGPAVGFLPSFKAFLISAAFHAAYFCFCSSCKRNSQNHKNIQVAQSYIISPKCCQIRKASKILGNAKKWLKKKGSMHSNTHIRLNCSKLTKNLKKDASSIKCFSRIPTKGQRINVKNRSQIKKLTSKEVM